MKFKSEKGVTGIDIATGILIFTIACVVVVGMYYQIYTTTVETKVHQIAISCITEICEKIDLEDYDKITEQRIEEMIEESGINEYFNREKNDSYIVYTLTNYKQETGVEEDLVKKINFTIVYTVGNNKNTIPINKIKIRELI